MNDAAASTAIPTVTGAPRRPALVLTALILAALVCNINLAAANIALPEIGDAFGAGQTSLNLVALGCSLGLAMSVLYLGALADRYGRKQLLLVGLALTVLASFFAAFAPSIELLIIARLFTGIAAGMAYPTTLSLITALWVQGKRRTTAIALWSSVSAMSSVIGSVLAGLLLEKFWWGSAFLLAAPIAAVGFILVAFVVPSHVAESGDRVDHFGGVLSVFAVAALVLGIGIVFAPGDEQAGITLIVLAVVLFAAFAWRQMTAVNPLYQLKVARRRMFWVPALAGMVVFGALMGFMFVAQQFLQDILGYGTLDAGLAAIPAAVGLLLIAPFSARLVSSKGTRATMLAGYGLVFVGFVTTLFWREDTPYWLVGAGFFIIGCGVAFAMTPASRALTDSTPVHRVGMASATSDLQRDLGGSILQALLGAILAAGFARSFGKLISSSSESATVTAEITRALQASYSSALHVADKYPQYKDQILAGATQSLVTGALGAYLVGAIAIIVGAALIAIFVPSHAREKELLIEYARRDAADIS
ncbi:EmrB/QacA subfamily drug resistance transporter [Microbacterium endophyticum]|uniref:EmrB/QacA subfamily drug resistance transporter n=1 Tax=Microbacterium endophyticum TaxID=1526412 RepID=A0A7W4V4N0_9MICO|nr:MFS transporter [Microbacterium endophyticum]MBB2976786.1 EmrB/QacA subfamily drug resistance transporter [Microbacterium endophyticum]NIK36577.1 EmrB/QacA subfamily drug resistance transporter [Microbacterium endophyticum]